MENVAYHFSIVVLGTAGVSYGQSMACIVSWSVSVGDRKEGRDLNEKMLGADNGR